MKRRSDHPLLGPAVITRRRLLELGLLAGATGLAGSVRPVAAQDRSSRPRRGGALKVARLGTPKLLDPAMAVVSEEFMITMAIYDRLVYLDENLEPQPQLATRWEPNPSGDVWTFTLRQGVKFHHGRELTARDVVFTFERILDPKTGSPGRKGVGPIEKIEPVGDYAVRFTLSGPYVDLPEVLAGHFGCIVPADRGESIATAPSGTGAFRLAEFKPGEYTRMVRFGDYWEKGIPYLDELWQVNMPQAPTQIAALSGGDIHVMFEVPAAYVRSLERVRDVVLVEVKSPGFQTVSLMTTEKPFNDNRVRQAMKYLVDREAIVRTIWQGRAEIGEDHSVPKFHPFYAPTTPVHAYDVARAKALLAEAGYPSGLSLELWTSNERIGLQELAVAVQQMAAPGGLKIDIKTVPWSVFTANVWKKKTFYCSNWNGRPTIDDTLFPFFHSTGGFNEGRYSNPELDRLLEEGRGATDRQKRKEIYARALQLIHTDGCWVVPYHANFVTALRGNVKDQVINPLRWWDSRRTYLEV